MNGHETSKQVLRNRRFAVMFVAALLVFGISFLLRPDAGAGDAEANAAASATPTTPARPLSEQTRLVSVARLTGSMTPRSISASPAGTVLAANMMYGHNLSVFAADATAQGTIEDTVDLSAFGITGHPGTSRGAPAEAAFTPDSRYAYVTNYAMYGEGFPPEPKESCTAADNVAGSYLYRIDLSSRAIDQVIPVGAVPRSVAVSPDGHTVVVANWCSANLSVINTATGTGVGVPVEANPHGLAISPDSRTAYVTLSRANKLVTVDLAGVAGGLAQAQDLAATEAEPRAVAVAADGRSVFVANDGAGTVTKIDTSNGAVLAKAATGKQPRSVAVSADGSAVFVTNYGSGSLTKLRAADLGVLEEVKTDTNPTGVAYEPTQARVWVACYSGSVMVFDDSGSPAQPSTGITEPGADGTGTAPATSPTGGSATSGGTGAPSGPAPASPTSTESIPASLPQPAAEPSTPAGTAS